MEERSKKLRQIFTAMIEESDTIRMLREDPEKLAKRFKLSPDELSALRSADRLVISMRPRAVTFDTGSTFTVGLRGQTTFETGSTITVTAQGQGARPRAITFDTGMTITA